MNCSSHPDTAAMGICCSCGRFVCVACNQGASGKLICSPECEKDLRAHDAAIDAILSKTNRGGRTTGVFCLAMGLGALILACYHVAHDPVPVLIGISLTVGVVFCVVGVFYLRVAKAR